MPQAPSISPSPLHPASSPAAPAQPAPSPVPSGPLGGLIKGVAWLGRAPAPLRFGLALAFFGVSLWSRFALGLLLPSGFPFLTFFPAVLMAAMLTGLGPSLLVSLLSVLSAWYWFLQPVPGFSLETPQLIAVVFFSVILLVDCLVIHGLKTALRRVSFAERKYRHAQTELLQREAMLRTADEQKDVFLATLAHELRNPLSPIRSAAELIRLRQPVDPSIRQAGAVIERQVQHMAHLVDDLLDISRLTRNTIELRPETLDLRSVIDYAVETVRPTLEAAGLKFTQLISLRPVLVYGDATRLGQCVLNLLTNAVKFTPRGGNVHLHLRQHGALAVLEVQDTGLGIDASNLDRIFQLFVQEHPSGLQGQSGLGLGLAITRKLVMLHGGSVVASSEGRGKGSSFRIDLPTASETATSTPPKAEPPSAQTSALATQPKVEAAAQVRGPAAGVQVLVIEDNTDAADLLAQILDLHEFSTRVAYDGEQGLALARQTMPDVVLLDLGLPDVDGYEVCRQLRRMSAPQQPVVIALTGWGSAIDRDRSTQAGCDAHLTKPADPDALLALLDELLQARTPAAQPA